MKTKYLSLIALFLILQSGFTQNGCQPNNGVYAYTFKLNTPDVPQDYDKDDFINYITSNEDISSTDLNTLSTGLIYVKKGFSSNSSNNGVKATSTLDVYNILAQLDNTVHSVHCHLTACEQSDGSYGYYLLLYETNLPLGFDKTDLINYIINNDTISDNDLSTLNESIIEVYQPFGFSTNPFHHRILRVISDVELYSIFDSLNNAIAFHECSIQCLNEEDCLLGQTLSSSNFNKKPQSYVYPNPVTENSVIDFRGLQNKLRLEVIDISGKVIFSKAEINPSNPFKLNQINIDNGVYFIKISELNTNFFEIIKFLK